MITIYDSLNLLPNILVLMVLWFGVFISLISKNLKGIGILFFSLILVIAIVVTGVTIHSTIYLYKKVNTPNKIVKEIGVVNTFINYSSIERSPSYIFIMNGKKFVFYSYTNYGYFDLENGVYYKDFEVINFLRNGRSVIFHYIDEAVDIKVKSGSVEVFYIIKIEMVEDGVD